jgi:hypothetical protein
MLWEMMSITCSQPTDPPSSLLATSDGSIDGRASSMTQRSLDTNDAVMEPTFAATLRALSFTMLRRLLPVDCCCTDCNLLPARIVVCIFTVLKSTSQVKTECVGQE